VRYVPAGTLSGNRVLTVGATASATAGSPGCVDGDRLTVVRLDVSANTYEVRCAVNGSIITLPASEAWFVDLLFAGAGWVLMRAGRMTP
jgi:hypothetical protein